MRKTVIPIIVVIQLIVLLTLSSFAWFADRTNPSIEESSIQIAAADGLLIRLTPDSEERLVVNLNQVISDFELFELKQVSSANADDFFYVDFGAGLSYNDPEFVQVEYEQDGTLDMHHYGFVDYDFYLQAEQYDKFVYLHMDTMMDGPADEALRIAITIDETVIIFGKHAENGISDPFTTEAVINEGEFDFHDIDEFFVTNQLVHVFSDKGGGRELDDDAPLDESKILTMIEAEETLQVNVKIWLEGGDVSCNNTLAGTEIDIVIKFGSANVLLDAPAVTANNNTMTIDGLNTTMEYSFDLPPNDVWYDVTDPAMTFSVGQTVYVRIAEEPGVSPPSKITQVDFD